MEASVDISMYPLNEGYEKHIIEFIKEVQKNSKLKVVVNGMSTQIFGEYDEIMDCLKIEMKESFKKAGNTIFALKILNINAEEAKID